MDIPTLLLDPAGLLTRRKYAVTEYGVAYLHGNSIWERTKAQSK
jgi:Acetyl-CoA hydrolase/transferase C-terminal domain